MLVVDASCLFEVLASTRSAQPIRERLAEHDDQAAPEVIDVEILSVVRKQHLLGRLDDTAANQAVADLRDWPGERFSHRLLLDRAWALRGTVRPWEAMYVALAEALDATLLTTDGRLARASGPQCRIEVVHSGGLSPV